VLRDVQSALAHAGAKRMHWGFVADTIVANPDAPATLFDAPWGQTSP
jgi:hypothetical protein